MSSYGYTDGSFFITGTTKLYITRQIAEDEPKILGVMEVSNTSLQFFLSNSCCQEQCTLHLFDEHLECTMQSNLVCLVHAPAVMIPVDIVKYFSAYIREVVCMRVFRHIDMDEYMIVFECRNYAIADNLIRDYNTLLLSSLEPSFCTLRLVKSMSCGAYSIFGQNSSPSALHSFPLAATYEGTIITSGGTSRLTLSSPSLLRTESLSPELLGEMTNISNTSSSNAGLEPSARSSSSSSSICSTEVDLCVLCLETLCKGDGVFVAFCSHAFHLQCVLMLEGPQCPICRYVLT